MNKNIKYIEIIYSVFKLNSPHLLENKNCFIYPESGEDLEEKIINFCKNPDIKFKEFLYVSIVGEDNIVIDRYLPDRYEEILWFVHEKVDLGGLSYCQDKKDNGSPWGGVTEVPCGSSFTFGNIGINFCEPDVNIGLMMSDINQYKK